MTTANRRNGRSLAILLLIGALLAPAIYAAEASAGGAERRVSREGAPGHARAARRHRDVVRGAKRIERDTTWTGPRGRDVETHVVSERTDDGYTRSLTHTGPQGQTVTKEVVATRTDDGFTRSVVREGPKGTSTSEIVVERDPQTKTITRSAEHVLPDGRTASTHTEITKTEDGSTRSTTRVGPNGQTLQIEAERSVDPETGSVTRTVTRTRDAGGDE